MLRRGIGKVLGLILLAATVAPQVLAQQGDSQASGTGGNTYPEGEGNHAAEGDGPVPFVVDDGAEGHERAASEAAESRPRGPRVRGTTPPSASRWVAPQPEQAKQLNEQVEKQAPRVRIGLRLTPFAKVVTRERNGKQSQRFVPAEPLRHTLRARLNKTNHFFVGDYHIETQPTRWVRKSRRYEVRLNIFRRYGAFGQLEENVGALDLAGVLDEQEDNVHVLIGVARARLRDRMGNPVIDVVAGFAPGAAAKAPLVKGPSVSGGFAVPPMSSDQPLLRGRF